MEETAYVDILQRLTKLETNSSSILTSLEDLKHGIAMRVEKHGEDIAVIKDKVDDLEASKKWVITSIVGAYMANLLGAFKK